MPEPIQVEFTTEGIEQVKAAFSEIAESSRRTSEGIKRNSENMSRSFRAVATDLTVFTSAGRSVLRLSETFGILTKEQTKATRTMLDMISASAGLISAIPTITGLLASETMAHWANTIAKWAEAHATAVLVGLTGVGLALVAAAIAAGAAVSAEGARSVSSISAPHLAGGGIVERPTFALIGERGPEAVVPLNRFAGSTIIINYPTFRNRSEMDYLLDRLKRMGMA